MNDQPEFMACPFCGNYPDAFSNGDVTCSTEMCPGYTIVCTKSDWNKRPASVPPAGDVEVKRYSFKGAAGLYVYEGDFTRLTAERDGLKADYESLSGMYKRAHDIGVAVMRERDTLQSELTKARELLHEALRYDAPADLWLRVSDFIAHQSAPAAKGGA